MGHGRYSKFPVGAREDDQSHSICILPYVHPRFTCVLSGCQAIQGCSSRPESEFRTLKRNLGVLFRSSSPQGHYYSEYGKYGNKDQSPLCRAIIRKGTIISSRGYEDGMSQCQALVGGQGCGDDVFPPKRDLGGLGISNIVSALSDLHWYWGTDHLLVMQFD